MALAGSPTSRLRTGSAVRVVFVGATKRPNFVVESYKSPGPDFPLKEGEILLKMRLATICEEDLDVLTKFGPGNEIHPRVIGHEGVGEVVAWRPGEDTSLEEQNLQVGDRLVFSPWSGSCSQCPCCKQSRFLKCPRAEKYGHHSLRESSRGPVIQGGTFASHLVLRQGTQVVRVPEDLSDTLASSLPCVLAPLMRVASALETLPNKEVAVVQGASLRGAYTCAVLKELGFKQVYCLDSDMDALRHISRFGGTPVQDYRYFSTGIINNRIPRPGPNKADLVVRLCDPASCTSSPLPLALDLLKPSGTLVLAGGSTSSCTQGSSGDGKQSSTDLWWDKVTEKEITVKGICSYSLPDIYSAVSFVHRTSSTYPYEILFSPVQPSLYDFPTALSIAKSNRHCRVPVFIS